MEEAEQKFITAESGQNVTLTCLVPTTGTIRVVKWSRAEQGDQYVLLYRDGLFVPDDQHPSFMNRVDLQDRRMKDGDVSVILKNVTVNDAGTYECHVFTEETRSLKLIINIYLRVVAPPGPGGEGAPVSLIVGLAVAAVLFVAVTAGGFLIYRRYIQNKNPNG